MKSKAPEVVHQSVAGVHKSGIIAEDTESFLAAVAGTLGNDFPDDITDDDIGSARKPGAWSGLRMADVDCDSQNTNAEIAQTLNGDGTR